MKIFGVLASVSVIASVFYVTSTVYYEGYFRYFELDKDCLHRNAEHVIYNGFLILLNYLPYILITLIILSFILFLMFCMHLKVKFSNFNNLNIKSLAVLNSKNIGKSIKNKSIFSLPLPFVLIFLFLATFLCVSSLMLLYKDGQSEAKELYNKIKTRHFHDVRCIHERGVDIKNNQITYFLFCGSDICAGKTIKNSLEYFDAGDITISKVTKDGKCID